MNDLVNRIQEEFNRKKFNEPGFSLKTLVWLVNREYEARGSHKRVTYPTVRRLVLGVTEDPHDQEIVDILADVLEVQDRSPTTKNDDNKGFLEDELETWFGTILIAKQNGDVDTFKSQIRQFIERLKDLQEIYPEDKPILEYYQAIATIERAIVNADVQTPYKVGAETTLDLLWLDGHQYVFRDDPEYYDKYRVLRPLVDFISKDIETSILQMLPLIGSVFNPWALGVVLGDCAFAYATPDSQKRLGIKVAMYQFLKQEDIALNLVVKRDIDPENQAEILLSLAGGRIFLSQGNVGALGKEAERLRNQVKPLLEAIRALLAESENSPTLGVRKAKFARNYGLCFIDDYDTPIATLREELDKRMLVFERRGTERYTQQIIDNLRNHKDIERRELAREMRTRWQVT